MISLFSLATWPQQASSPHQLHAEVQVPDRKAVVQKELYHTWNEIGVAWIDVKSKYWIPHGGFTCLHISQHDSIHMEPKANSNRWHIKTTQICSDHDFGRFSPVPKKMSTWFSREIFWQYPNPDQVLKQLPHRVPLIRALVL